MSMCKEVVKKLAKYKVQDVKEEDGVYTVSVQVEPSNGFQTLQQSSTEVSNEKIKQGLNQIHYIVNIFLISSTELSSPTISLYKSI